MKYLKMTMYIILKKKWLNYENSIIHLHPPYMFCVYPKLSKLINVSFLGENFGSPQGIKELTKEHDGVVSWKRV